MNFPERWMRELPRSRMVYPDKFDKRVKYLFWRAFTPIHPIFRELCMPVRKMRGRAKRQDHLIGTLLEDRSVREFAQHLVAHGFRRHGVAWRDPDQILSMRKVESFEWQYHVRIYSDGEVRGHYELTPECHPFKHLKRVHMQDRREDFLGILEGWIREEY